MTEPLMSTSSVDRRWVDAAVLLTLATVFTVTVAQQYEPYTFLHGDGAFYANINRTIHDSLGLAQGDVHPRSWIEDDLGWNRDLDQGWSNVTLGRDDVTWWPKHPFLMPIASTPFYVLFGTAGLLVFNVLQTVLLLFFAYRAAARLVPPSFAAAATLAFATSRVFLDGAYSYSNDLFYALLVVAAVDALLGERWKTAGALLGMAVWAKVTNGLFVAPVGVWLLARRRWRPVIAFSAAFAVPIGLFLVANAWMFGAPWNTSYDRILIRRGGQMALESARVRFNVPFGLGLGRLLVDSRAGIWRNAPLFFLALPGLAPLLRRRVWLGATVAFSLLGFLWFYARYDYLYARFFLPWAGLGVLLAAVGLDGLRSVAAGVGARLAGRVPAAARRFALPVVVVAAAVVVGAVWLGETVFAGPARRLVDRVETAEVRLGDVPCDYFNPARQKWECSQLERQPWEYAGRSMGRECVRGGAPWEAVWLHPSPTGRPKRMTFPDLPATAAVTVVASRAGDRAGAVTVVLSANGAAVGPIELPVPGASETETFATPSLAEGGGTLTLEVSGRGSGAGRGVCLDVRLEAP